MVGPTGSIDTADNVNIDGFLITVNLTYSCLTRLEELETEDGNGEGCGCGYGFVALW